MKFISKKSIQICVLLMVSGNVLVSAQVPEVLNLSIVQSANPELKKALEYVLKHDSAVDFYKQSIAKQDAKVLATNKIPNTELSLNYTPLPMQKALNQTLSFKAMQKLPWPGSISKNIDAEEEIVNEKKWLTLNLINDRMFVFAKKWLSTWGFKQQIDLITIQIKLIDRLEMDAQKKLETSSDQSQLINLEIEKETLLIKKKQFESSFKSSLSELNAFGLSDFEYNFPDTLRLTSQPDVSSIFENHPLIYAAESRKNAGKLKKIAAQKEGMPILSVGAEYMWIDEAMTITIPQMQMQSAFSVMAVIGIPTFRKQYSGKVKEAVETTKEAEFEEFKIKEELKSKWKKLQIDLKLRIDELELYQTTLPKKINQLILLEKERLKNGNPGIERWIQAENKRLTYAIMAINALVVAKQTEMELNWLNPLQVTEIN